jgi:hypothetical protein
LAARSALYPGENRSVDSFGKLFLAKHNPAARSAQTFVRRRRDEVCVRHRAWMFAARNQTGDVRHVDEEQRADRVSDLPHTLKINEARIGRRAGSDQLRLHFFCELGERIVIDLLGLLAHAVLRDLIKFSREIGRMAMSQMAAVGQVHRQNTIARLNRGKVNRHVGLRAAVRLDIDVFRPKKLFRAIDRQLFDYVDILTAAIPAFARVTFGILIRQAGALRLHDRAAGKVFRGNQLDVLALAAFLRDDRFVNFWIDLAQRPSWTAAFQFVAGFRFEMLRHISQGTSGSATGMGHNHFGFFYEGEHAR